MNKSDNYEKFLRLACRTSQNSTPLASVSNQKHPGVLNGLRNKENQSFKVLCSPSKIFDFTDTPLTTERKALKHEASERKRQYDSNTVRTVNPSLEKCQSPEVKQSIRYNVNTESIYKEPKRYYKTCSQKSQDFNHRINLPISKMQVNDVVENIYGQENYKSHKKSQSIKTFIDLQSSPDQFQIYTDRAKTTHYDESYRHLLTSYQSIKENKNNGKKKYPQSQSIYQQTQNKQDSQNIKPINKIFQISKDEQNQQIQKNRKGLGEREYNQQKSSLKIY